MPQRDEDRAHGGADGDDDWGHVPVGYDWSTTPDDVRAGMADFRRLMAVWVVGTLTVIGGVALSWVGHDAGTHPVIHDPGVAMAVIGVLSLAGLRIVAGRHRRAERRRVRREQDERDRF